MNLLKRIRPHPSPLQRRGSQSGVYQKFIKIIRHYVFSFYCLFELDFIDKETVKGEIDGVQIDCIAHKYPWLTDPIEINGIRLAGYEDLAAMKLNAIVGNGTRIKDYIDIAYISGKITLNEMLNAYQTKYASNGVMVLKAIAYFDDINFVEPISMLDTTNFDWRKIRKHLLLMIKHPDKVFDKIE